MTNEEKIKEQEILEEKRKRQMAILKASNELLRQSKEKALKHTTDPVRRADLERDFDKALEYNRMQGDVYLHATEEEIENSEYRKVDKSYVDKYNKRLEERGITDEELHRKESATVTTGTPKKGGGIPRRARRGQKKDESEIVRLENEDEIMNSTRVKDESDIEKQVHKNQEYENEQFKKREDISEKVKDIKNEEISSRKIDKEKTLENEKITVENATVKPQNEGLTVQNTTVKSEEKESETKDATAEVKPKRKKKQPPVKYDFDFSQVPSWVQYDVLPLPSNGQCYPSDSPLRCGRIPVAYLTAADENVIVSPNAYRDGKILDIILKRKVLDKRINTDELTSGDKDAVILWLRATSYGQEFPITARNPQTGKQYDVTIDLSQFNYNEFDLEGDENGYFDYTTSGGDIIKFKFFTSNDDQEFRHVITQQVADANKVDVLKNLNQMVDTLNDMEFSDEERSMMKEDIDEIKDIVGTDLPDIDDSVFPSTITEQMIMHTMSVNGNTDREYIRNYVENMRTRDAMGYRNYFVNNKPGVDFNFTVNIPESDGGGSFNTFLGITDTIFINH